MSSEVKANKVSPASGTDFTFGDSGDTFTVPSGATLDVTSATVTGLSVGKVLQVVSATKTDTASTTSLTFVSTGLEVAITPSENWLNQQSRLFHQVRLFLQESMAQIRGHIEYLLKK